MSKKDEIIVGLSTARENLVNAAVALPPEKRDEVFLGEWSVRDLLAHVIGWDYANTDAVYDIRAGKLPRVFQHWSPDWTQFNARLVREYKLEDWDEMLAMLNKSQGLLMRLLNNLPPEDFLKDFGARTQRGRVVTIALHIQAEIDDEREHFEQIEKWLGAR